MELQNHKIKKELHITQKNNTYTVLTILRNHRTKVVVELENPALNYGTAEPQHKTTEVQQKYNIRKTTITERCHTKT